MSFRPFWEIVKSAAPTLSTPAAVVRMLSVTMPSTTTTRTPTATADAVSIDRTFFDQTLWPISQRNDMDDPSVAAAGARLTSVPRW